MFAMRAQSYRRRPNIVDRGLLNKTAVTERFAVAQPRPILTLRNSTVVGDVASVRPFSCQRSGAFPYAVAGRPFCYVALTRSSQATRRNKNIYFFAPFCASSSFCLNSALSGWLFTSSSNRGTDFSYSLRSRYAMASPTVAAVGPG